MIDAILNLIFPVQCVICHDRVEERRFGAACPECWGRLTPLTPPFCPVCGMPAPAIEGPCGACRLGDDHAFDFGRSALLFDDNCRELIHHFKYSDRVSLAKPFGEILKVCLDQAPFTADVILPVPLHRSRRRQRGFNQAELLAEQLHRPVNPHILRRRKNTKTQTGLTRPQRAANLGGAFEVRGPGKPPASVIVVDDVYTTGSTLNEISKTLKRAGVQRVEVLTLARVPEVQ
jgi:competence protein ComFC